MVAVDKLTEHHTQTIFEILCWKESQLPEERLATLQLIALFSFA
tara:strand:- start:221 stop:352 length:132 start_codon:yes stop_codon:yes gene_type:complete